jgi:Leucine-rich repeat (LRR) protein
VAPQSPIPKTSKSLGNVSGSKQDQVAAKIEVYETKSPRSSAALRETIAKAKAARKRVAEEPGTQPPPSVGLPAGKFESSEDVLSPAGEGTDLLRKRIQKAITSGQLNIAGMSLKEIPSEVMKMYNPENSSVNWSEMVDLVKLNAADNEFDHFGSDVFPDYSESELENDEEKCNQFGGLENIDLRRNRIQYLPIGLRRLTRLRSLDLSGNRFTNEAFTVLGQIPQLVELAMNNNVFSGVLDLGKGNWEHLQVLDLRGNSIEGFDDEGLSSLKSLKKLDVSDNKLSTLPWTIISTLPLAELNVSKNQLSGTLFSHWARFNGLRVLDASFNALEQLSDVDIELSSLQSLILDGNRITKLPNMMSYKQLQVLRVSDNQLDEISSDFLGLEGLKSADFGYNNIKLIPSEIARMDSLSSLNLVGNPLREKKYLTLSTSELKSNLEKKLYATLDEPASPDDTTLPSNSVGSHYRYKATNGILDLSSQSLKSVDVADIDLGDSNASIHTLKLSNNDLSTFPTEILSHPALKYSLHSLDLSHNPFLHPTEYLSAELFLPNLKSLYIVSTGLTSLDALTTHLKAPALAELNIACHRLTGRVPWVRAWWPDCVTLLATDNWFSSIDVEGVRGLEVLDVRNNEIESLPPKLGLLGNPPGSARQPGKLRLLEVSGNRFRVPRLSIVEKGTEAVLKDLRRMISSQEVPEEWRGSI